MSKIEITEEMVERLRQWFAPGHSGGWLRAALEAALNPAPQEMEIVVTLKQELAGLVAFYGIDPGHSPLERNAAHVGMANAYRAMRRLEHAQRICNCFIGPTIEGWHRRSTDFDNAFKHRRKGDPT